MDITLLVTKTDFCVPNLECEFNNLGLNYRIEYIENNPELVNANQIRHSPNIFVDGKLAFRDQPTPQELKDYFSR
ncbi:MAG: hypothetical protein HRT38_03685 [Alteromonadaceae bacterium]|nr:hypothetical protein [Alteromonadaceae bacterium]